MTPQELIDCLSYLKLSPAEVAQLLGVSTRTVRRWLEGENVPGPAEQALRAWRRLQQHNLAWRPDADAVFGDNQEQIRLYRDEAIALNKMLANVKARGRAPLPWVIDLNSCRATLGGKIDIWFYRLVNGGFTLSSYSREDIANDLRRDWELIEEAAYCIAKELKKETGIPVILVYSDKPSLGGTSTNTQRKFQSYEAAIQYARERIGSAGFHDPFVMEDMTGKDRDLALVWDKLEVKRDCERYEK
jgi:transcriptional regulator with XRE-family HTH domain